MTVKVHTLSSAQYGITSVFFNEPEQLDALRLRILKPWHASLKRNSCLRIWSMGCATGAEGWSLAMAVAEFLPDWQRLDIRILATDTDAGLVASAQQGQFDEALLAGLTPAQLGRWFKPRSRQGNQAGCKVQPELAAIVRHAVFDPSAKLSFTGPIDAIFCRNGMTDWDVDLQQRMLNNFAVLQPRRGLVCFGSNERHLQLDAGYSRIGRGLYLRNEVV